MPGLPTHGEFNDVTVTKGGFRSATAQLLDFLSGLLGTSGSPADARVALGLGAMPTIYVNRGSWVTGTAYNLNDVVIQSSIAYVCMIAHTSGTFSTDATAGKWAVYQGVTATELAASSGAALVGFGAGTVADALSALAGGIQVWDSGVTYAAGTAYVSRSGDTYKSVASSTGEDPATDTGTNWVRWGYTAAELAALLAPILSALLQGVPAWSSATAYVGNDYVQRSGSTYKAVASSTNIDPATDGGSHWVRWGYTVSELTTLVQSLGDARYAPIAGGLATHAYTTGGASGTITVPAGVYRFKYRMIGGGGDAGSNVTGAAGGYCEGWRTCVPGDTIAYHVGMNNGGTSTGNSTIVHTHSGTPYTITAGGALASSGGSASNGVINAAGINGISASTASGVPGASGSFHGFGDGGSFDGTSFNAGQTGAVILEY